MKKLFPLFLLLFSNIYLFGQIEFISHFVDEKNEKLKDIQVVIYDGNEVILNEKSSKKISFNLLPNKYFTLELSKEGYYTKRIMIETHAGKTQPPQNFEFKIELVKISIESQEKDSDFPVGIIKYAKNKGGFHFDIIKNSHENEILTENK